MAPIDKYHDLVISDETKRLVEGWANANVTDRQNDVIPTKAMMAAMLGYMDKGGILLLGHENRPVGKVLHWSVGTPAGSQAEGIRIIATIYNDSALGDAAWQLIKEKQVTGFSIGGQASETKEIRDKSAVGGMARELTKIELNEISLVQVPANQLATVEGFSVAKSAGPASKQQHFYAETRDKAESLSQRLQAEGKVVQSIIQIGDEWDVAYTATVNPSNEQGGREEQHPTPTSSSERTQKPGAAFSEHDKPATAGEAQKRLKMALKQAGLIWKDDDDSGASALMSVLPMLLDAEGEPEDEEKAEDQSAPIALDAESGTYDAGKYGGYMGKEGGTPSTPVGKDSKPDYAAEVYTDEARRRGMTGMEGNAYVRARKAGKSPGEAQTAAWKETRDREFMQPKSITKVWKAIPNGDGTFRVDSNHSKGGRVPFKFADEATAKQYIEYHRMNEKPHKAELGKDAMSSGTPGAENAVYSDVKKPVRSRAQWGYLAAKHPEILHRWTHENGQTGPGAESKLPEHVKEMEAKSFDEPRPGDAEEGERGHENESEPVHGEAAFTERTDPVAEEYTGDGRIYQERVTEKGVGSKNLIDSLKAAIAATEEMGDEELAAQLKERLARAMGEKAVIGTPGGTPVIPAGRGTDLTAKASEANEQEAGDGTCAACGVDGKVAERNGKEYCSDCYMLGGEEGYPMEDGLVKETYEEYMSHNSEEESARDTAGRKQRGQEHFGGANKEVGAEGKCHTCGADVHPGQEQRVCIHGGKKEQRGSNTDANIGDIGIGVERGSKGTPPLSKLEKLVRALAKGEAPLNPPVVKGNRWAVVTTSPKGGQSVTYHNTEESARSLAATQTRMGGKCEVQELTHEIKSVRGGKKGDTPLESPVKKGGKMRKLLIGLAKFESNRCAECGESKETHMENPSWHKFVRLWDEQTTPPESKMRGKVKGLAKGEDGVTSGFTHRHTPATPEQTKLREQREREISQRERELAETPEGKREAAEWARRDAKRAKGTEKAGMKQPGAGVTATGAEKGGDTPRTPTKKANEAPSDSDVETHSYSTEYPACPKCGARAKRDSNGNWCTRCDWERTNVPSDKEVIGTPGGKPVRGVRARKLVKDLAKVGSGICTTCGHDDESHDGDKCEDCGDNESCESVTKGKWKHVTVIDNGNGRVTIKDDEGGEIRQVPADEAEEWANKRERAIEAFYAQKALSTSDGLQVVNLSKHAEIARRVNGRKFK